MNNIIFIIICLFLISIILNAKYSDKFRYKFDFHLMILFDFKI